MISNSSPQRSNGSVAIKTARQAYYIILWLVNLLLMLVPGVWLRVMVLNFTGQRVSWRADIHRGVKIMSLKPGTLVIEPHVIVNPNVLLDNRGGLILQRDCAISSGCALYSYGHDHAIAERPTVGRPVVIGQGAFIYSRSIILPGVRVRKYSVIGAGSVVTKSTTSHGFYGGNPARCISEGYSKAAYNKAYRYGLVP